MSEPNDKVKAHLQKRNVKASELPNSVINTMNTLSQDELDALDKVGGSFDDANVPPGKAITAIH